MTTRYVVLFYVQIDRDDGSRTYKGPWVHAHCTRELNAWRHAFPHYSARLVLADSDVRADVRRFARATKVDPVTGHFDRYYPQPVEPA